MAFIPWWLNTIFYGIFSASFDITAQQLKGNLRLTTIYYGIGNFLIMLPFMLFIDAPKGSRYYILILIAGLIIFINDRRWIQTVSKYGSIVTATFSPLSIPLMTVVWWILNPYLLFDLLKQFDKFIITVICVATPVLSIFVYNYYGTKNHNDMLNKKAFNFFIPCIIMGIFQGISIRYAIEPIETLTAVIYTSGLISLINGSLNLIALIMEKNFSGYKKMISRMSAKKERKSGLYSLLFLTLYAFFKYQSLKFAPNPAYVSAITISISPIMTITFNKIYKIKSKVNYKLTAIFVLSSLMLILASLKK